MHYTKKNTMYVYITLGATSIKTRDHSKRIAYRYWRESMPWRGYTARLVPRVKLCSPSFGRATKKNSKLHPPSPFPRVRFVHRTFHDFVNISNASWSRVSESPMIAYDTAHLRWWKTKSASENWCYDYDRVRAGCVWGKEKSSLTWNIHSSQTVSISNLFQVVETQRCSWKRIGPQGVRVVV